MNREGNLVAWLWQFLGSTPIVIGVLGGLAVFASHGSLKKDLGQLLVGPVASAVAGGFFALASSVGVVCFIQWHPPRFKWGI